MFSRFLSAFLISFVAPLSMAYAQGPAEEVVVSASRVPIAAQQSGSALSVIDGAVLEARQIETPFDALRSVPGIAVSRSGALGALSEIRIRGGEANHTLVLIDGVEANDPAQQSEFNFAHLLSPGIERIEVLRGPQSALWGADAVSGVVNIVTVAPTPGLFARGSAEGGSFATRQVSGLFNAGTETAGAVLHAAYLKTDGINIAETGSEKDGYENLTLGGRGFVQMAPEFVLSGSLRHVNGNNDYDSGFPVPIDTGNYSHSAQTYGRAQAKLTLFGGSLEAIAGASLTRTRADNFLDGALTNDSSGGKTKFDLQANGFWSGTMFGASLKQRVSAAAETARETFKQHYVGFALADQSEALNESGAAVEYWAGYDERVFVSLGARHDWNQRFADATTWRATISAPIAAFDARLHASAGTGVKNPDFFELFGFIPSSFVGNPSLTPETSFGYDAGVAFGLFAQALRLDLTYFHADLEDEIFTDFAAFPSTARNMRGKSERQGVEVGATAELGEGWSLAAAYTYTESTANDVVELRRPRHVGSLAMDYRFAGGKAVATVGADLHGSQRDTDFSTFKTVTLPAYTLVRLAGSYELGDGFTLTARIENALNQRYEEVIGYRARGFGAYAGIRAAVGK